MIRHPCPCDCLTCKQYSEWLAKQDFGLKEEDIKHMKKQVEVIKKQEQEILSLLKQNNYSVPEIAERMCVKDEITILQIIGYLENNNKIELKEFKTIYREDGGCIHLALYGAC